MPVRPRLSVCPDACSDPWRSIRPLYVPVLLLLRSINYVNDSLVGCHLLVWSRVNRFDELDSGQKDSISATKINIGVYTETSFLPVSATVLRVSVAQRKPDLAPFTSCSQFTLQSCTFEFCKRGFEMRIYTYTISWTTYNCHNWPG